MPLYDYDCEACGRVSEHYVALRDSHATILCDCGEPMTRLPISAGTSRKTGVFPFTSTHIDGTGQPIVVESLGHLRALEQRYGVLATAFSQNPNNQDASITLPEFREGGRAYEGMRLQDYVAQKRADNLRRAMRNMELRKYAGRTRVARRG